MSENMSDLLTKHYCTSEECPSLEKIPYGGNQRMVFRYAIELDEDDYKRGTVTDRLTGKKYTDERRPDEACVPWCGSVIGCPVRAEWLRLATLEDAQ